MAHYALQRDVVALYGSELLVRVADLDHDDQPDPDVVEAGLQAADDIINAYLSAKYTVPVTSVSGALRKCAIDIGIYTMAQEVTSRTEEMRRRYEDALAMLKLMAAGSIGLGLPPVDNDGDGIPDSNPNMRKSARIITVSRI